MTQLSSKILRQQRKKFYRIGNWPNYYFSKSVKVVVAGNLDNDILNCRRGINFANIICTWVDELKFYYSILPRPQLKACYKYTRTIVSALVHWEQLLINATSRISLNSCVNLTHLINDNSFPFPAQMMLRLTLFVNIEFSYKYVSRSILSFSNKVDLSQATVLLF